MCLPGLMIQRWTGVLNIIILIYILCTNNVSQCSQYNSMQQSKSNFEGETAQEKLDKTRDKINKPVSVLVMLISNQTELPIFYELLKPALDLAVENVNSRYTEFTLQVRSRKDVNTCEQNVIGALAAEEYHLRRMDGLIGPVCSRALEAAARLAAYWNLPIITAGGIGIEFSNKKIYRSLTRIAISLGLFVCLFMLFFISFIIIVFYLIFFLTDRVADFFTKIIQDYDWHHLSFIIDESEPANVLTKASFEKILRRLENYRIFLDYQEFSKKYTSEALEGGINYDKLLLNSKKAARGKIM